MLKLFFFGAELRGVRDKTAAGPAGRMLNVKHFVVEDIFDDKLWDFGAVHSAV